MENLEEMTDEQAEAYFKAEEKAYADFQQSQMDQIEPQGEEDPDEAGQKVLNDSLSADFPGYFNT